MALKDLKDKLEAKAIDLATLEVATFSGTVDVTTVPVDDNQSQGLFNAIKGALPDGTLVGYSRFEVEGDAINYLNVNLGPDQKFLLDSHSSLVDGAQKSRKDLFDFVLKVITGVKS